MRRRKSLISQLNRLSIEEKILSVCALTAMVACFFPWYGISSRIVDQWWNGFSNIGYIVGYLVFFMALTSLYAVLSPIFSHQVPKMLRSKMSHIVLFSQSTLLLSVLSFIYARYTIYDAPGSSVRFGLYTALIASFVASVAGYVLWKKNVADLRRMGAQEEFIHMPKSRHALLEEEMEPEENVGVYRDDQSSLIEEDETEAEEVYESEAEPVMAEVDEDVSDGDDDLDRSKTIEDLTGDISDEHEPRGIKESTEEAETEEVEEVKSDNATFNF